MNLTESMKYVIVHIFLKNIDFLLFTGIQFQKLKRCDRYWYENNHSGGSGGFTQAQLTEIRKITLSKLVCENCDIVGDIQRSIFDQPHEFL